MTIKLVYWFKNSSPKDELFNNISELVDFLKKNTHITALDLSWNNFGKEGAEALVPALQEMKNLISLGLYGNDVGKEGVQALILALQEMKSLASLYLGWNNLGKEGVEALIPILQKIKSLTRLSLSYNNLEEKYVQKLADKLPGCKVHVEGKYYTAQKLDKKLVVTSSVLFAVIGGVIAYAFSASTLGIIGGALFGALVGCGVAQVYEKVITKVDGADVTKHTGKEQQVVSQS